MGIDLLQDEESITCDKCGARVSFVHWPWGKLKEEGWTAIKDRDGEWGHHCPDCSKAGGRSLLDRPAKSVYRP